MNDKSGTGNAALNGFDGSDADFEALFAEMRDLAVAPSARLMARVLADAEVEMPVKRVAPLVARPATAVVQQSGGLRGLFAALGGWGGVGGLVSATVAGVWIGFADIGTSLGVTSLMGASAVDVATTVELMPGADAFATVGAAGG